MSLDVTAEQMKTMGMPDNIITMTINEYNKLKKQAER